MDWGKFSRSYMRFMLDDVYLTEDEEMIYHLLLRGKTIVQIADKMNLSTRTIDRRIRKLKDKLNID